MKYLYLTFLFIISSQLLLAQSPAEKAYLAVVNEGHSTGPSFVVMTIINSNTRESKEMILSVNELFNCLTMELNESDSKKVKKYLLSKSADRIITLKDPKALKLINFENYKAEKALKVEKEIDNVIGKKHLIDSLSKIDTITKKRGELFNEYYALRKKILKNIGDSISKIRTLNKKEAIILQVLHDPYYDGNEDQCDNLATDNKQDSISRKNILKVWDSKINLYRDYKQKYVSISNDLIICEDKFFRKYYKKYGMTFCKALFKYGAICFFGDENPQIGFGGVIK